MSFAPLARSRCALGCITSRGSGVLLVFEDLKPGARLRGLAPQGIAEIVQVSRFGAVLLLCLSSQTA